GVVQPVLREVGDRWERGEASVEEEHEVTRRCLAIYEALLERQQHLEALRRREPPDVLLACAPGNTHTIGLRMIELFLVAEGLAVRTELEPLSIDAIVSVVEDARPRIVGLSAALPEHLEAAAEISTQVATLGIGRVIVGGRAVREAAP